MRLHQNRVSGATLASGMCGWEYPQLSMLLCQTNKRFLRREGRGYFEETSCNSVHWGRLHPHETGWNTGQKAEGEAFNPGEVVQSTEHALFSC